MDLIFSSRNRCGYLIRQNDNIAKGILNKSKIIDLFSVSDEDVQWMKAIKKDTSKIKRVYLEEFSGGYEKSTIEWHTLSSSNFDNFEKCNNSKGNDVSYFDCYFKFSDTIEGCYDAQHVLFDDSVNGELKSDKYYYVMYGRYRGKKSVYYPRNIVVAYSINPKNFVESHDVFNDSEEEIDHDGNTPYCSDTDLEESYEDGGKLSEEFD